MLRNSLRKSMWFLTLADFICLCRYLSIFKIIKHFDIMVTKTTPDSYPGGKWRSPRDTRKDQIKTAAPFWDTWHRLGWPALASLSCILWGSDSPPSPQCSGSPGTMVLPKRDGFLLIWKGTTWREEACVPHARSNSHFPHQHALKSKFFAGQYSVIQQCFFVSCPVCSC